MTGPKNQNTLIAFAFSAIYLIWGTTYLAAILGLESFPPFLLSALRFCSAGAVLFLVCIIKGLQMPGGKSLIITMVSGIVMLVGGSGLVIWAEQYILSGYAAVVVASEPFIFVLLDRQRWRYYFNNRNIIAGLLIGFLGVLLFVWFSTGTATSIIPSHLVILGYGVLFLSCVLWVIGSIISSRHKQENTSAIAVSAMQLISAGIFCFILAWITNEFEGFEFANVTSRAWSGLLFLTCAGSIVAYLSFIWLLTVRSPAQVSTHTYINPIVALFMGWWFLNDPVNYKQLICVGVVLLGVLVTNRNKEALISGDHRK
jgi:drug/metabolite transporter (DMT)-like permease